MTVAAERRAGSKANTFLIGPNLEYACGPQNINLHYELSHSIFLTSVNAVAAGMGKFLSAATPG